MAGREVGQRKGIGTKAVTYLIILATLAIVPLGMPGYLQIVMTKFVIMALFSVSYDLIFGYISILSLGQAAFFGIGGYVVGVMTLHFEGGGPGSFWIAMALGFVCSVIVAIGFGIISLRFQGLYLLLITFALGQLFYSLAWNVPALNRPGMQGISGITWPDLGFPVAWTQLKFYYLVLIVFVLGFILLYKIVNSPFGHALVGIRESEPRMKALGFNTYSYKFVAFLISCGITGIAGVLFAYWNNMISPVHVSIGYSFFPMTMAILGSRGTLYGPVAGAAIIVFAEYLISLAFIDRWPLFLGVIFVVSIMLLRKGICQSIIDIIVKRTRLRVQGT